MRSFPVNLKFKKGNIKKVRLKNRFSNWDMDPTVHIHVLGAKLRKKIWKVTKTLVGRALALTVAVCYRNSMLQELYVFDKLFNKMIGRVV